jgi:uncharacterized protein YegP (UPF0339 family)
MRYVVIPQLRGRWIWELRNPAGETLCTSASSFISRERAFDAIQEVRAKAHAAGIVESPESASSSRPAPPPNSPGPQSH